MLNKIYRLKITINDTLYSGSIFSVGRFKSDNYDVVLHVLAENIVDAECKIVDKIKQIYGNRCKLVKILDIEKIEEEKQK